MFSKDSWFDNILKAVFYLFGFINVWNYIKMYIDKSKKTDYELIIEEQRRALVEKDKIIKAYEISTKKLIKDGGTT